MNFPQIPLRKPKPTSQVNVKPLNNGNDKESKMKDKLNESPDHKGKSSNNNLDESNNLTPLTYMTPLNNTKFDTQRDGYLMKSILRNPAKGKKNYNSSGKKVRFKQDYLGEPIVQIKEVESYKEYNYLNDSSTDDSCCCLIV